MKLLQQSNNEHLTDHVYILICYYIKTKTQEVEHDLIYY